MLLGSAGFNAPAPPPHALSPPRSLRASDRIPRRRASRTLLAPEKKERKMKKNKSPSGPTAYAGARHPPPPPRRTGALPTTSPERAQPPPRRTGALPATSPKRAQRGGSSLFPVALLSLADPSPTLLLPRAVPPSLTGEAARGRCRATRGCGGARSRAGPPPLQPSRC